MSFRRQLLTILLLLIAFALRLRFASALGIQADEGVHLTLANHVGRDAVLYRDLLWNHFPGVVWLVGGAFTLTGSSLFTARLLTAAAGLITVAGLVFAARQLPLGRHRYATGLAAAALFTVAPLAIFWSRFLLTETFETAAAILAVGAVLRAVNTGRPRWWLIAGVLAGAALLAKITGIVLLATLGLFSVAYWARRPTRAATGNLLAIGAGVALGVAPFVLTLLLQGSAADFFTLATQSDRITTGQTVVEKARLLAGWSTRSPTVLLALLALVPALRARRAAWLLLILWAGLEAAGLLLPARLQFGWGGFSHYVPPLLAATALLGAAGVTLLWRAGRGAWRSAGLVGAVALVAVAAAGWARDFDYVVRQTAYPEPDTAREVAISRIIERTTAPESTLLALANSGFYHWSGRYPAGPIFNYSTNHFAGLSADDTAAAQAILNATYDDPAVGAIVVSGLHQERMPPDVLAPLAARWQPVARLAYPYQHGITLFLPRGTVTLPVGEDAVGAYGDGITLAAAEAVQVGPQTVLVRLMWSAAAVPSADWSIFTHLVHANGVLVGQHDGPPALGARPATGWQPGELVEDWHPIEVGAPLDAGPYVVNVGLYNLADGARLPLADGSADAIALPLQPAGATVSGR